MRIRNIVATFTFAAALTLSTAFATTYGAYNKKVGYWDTIRPPQVAGYWDTARPPETAGYWDTDRYMPPTCTSSVKCAGTKAGV